MGGINLHRSFKKPKRSLIGSEAAPSLLRASLRSIHLGFIPPQTGRGVPPEKEPARGALSPLASRSAWRENAGGWRAGGRLRTCLLVIPGWSGGGPPIASRSAVRHGAPAGARAWLAAAPVSLNAGLCAPERAGPPLECVKFLGCSDSLRQSAPLDAAPLARDSLGRGRGTRAPPQPHTCPSPPAAPQPVSSRLWPPPPPARLPAPAPPHPLRETPRCLSPQRGPGPQELNKRPKALLKYQGKARGEGTFSVLSLKSESGQALDGIPARQEGELLPRAQWKDSPWKALGLGSSTRWTAPKKVVFSSPQNMKLGSQLFLSCCCC